MSPSEYGAAEDVGATQGQGSGADMTPGPAMLAAPDMGHTSDGRGGGGPRKRRRRQRSQRTKRRKTSPKESGNVDTVNRERMFQHVEGLLRQIREAAEEGGDYSEEEVKGYVTAVTSLTRVLEEESEPISDKARSEYLRVRDKLSQALRD